MRISHLVAATAAAALFAVATSASATVIISTGPAAVQPEEKLLFANGPAPGLSIEGQTNQTGTFFTLVGGETLVGAGGGTRLDTQDKAISTRFTYRGFENQLVGFDISDPALAFTSTEFRLRGGSATQATLTFVDIAGEIFQQTFAIPLSGFFSAQAIDGQLIDYFSIAANGSLGDIRRIRIGGVQAIPSGLVPEPASWALMIVGFGGVGTMLRRGRPQRRLAPGLI